MTRERENEGGGGTKTTSSVFLITSCNDLVRLERENDIGSERT